MKNIIKLIYLLLISILPINLFAQATSLPLVQINDLEYEGAFIPDGDGELFDLDYSPGTMTYNSTNGSIFLGGHQNFAVIAEFSIPALVNSTDLAALNSGAMLQDFRQVLQHTIGDYVEINLISGMAMVNDKLIINAVEFYDADANNLHTGVLLQNPSDIANSAINAYYSLEGAAHAAGWLSPVPAEWQTLLGGDYIAGNSSRYPINGRLAIGISAFAFNASDMTNASPGTVPTTTLLDFDLSDPLYADYNSYADAQQNLLEMNGDNSFTGHTAEDADIVVGSNDLWTRESEAGYGFIVPGTRTYMAFGSSGGHNSGIGYKPTQSDGNVCGGPCAYDADDYYNYYWLWDVNDLLAVKNGTLNPYDVRPYDYGVFDAPFQTDAYTQTPEFHPILGGTYDPDNGILYLSIEDGASTGQYEHIPAIAAYSISIETPPPPSAQCDCPEVTETGNIVTVQNVTELQNAISQANSQNGNMTIKVEPGVYQINNGFVIRPNMSNLTVMGTSGNRDDVFIKGQGYNGGTTAIFLVQADNFTVAHLTVGEVSTHGIQVQGEQDADDFTAVNVRFVDINEQFLKVSGGTSGSSSFSDRGRVFCCEFEFTAGIGYQYYTGGIDAHKSKDWIVQNNTFKGIRSPEYLLAEHAIHFWKVCENTIVTGNQISNCDRGIGFGLGDSPDNGHVGGLIMNNFVHTNRDVGIGLEYSPGTKVYNNTVITDNYPRSIEYRFPATTNVEITNNLVNGNIASRSGAPPATTSTNYTVSDLSIFTDAANYDYHLLGASAGIVDAGTTLSEVSVDIDCQNRNDAGTDIGADEFGANSNVCPPVENLTGNTTSNSIYHAAQRVISDATINADVIYKAGDEIELKSGFSTNPVNDFTGEIEDCDGNE